MAIDYFTMNRRRTIHITRHGDKDKTKPNGLSSLGEGQMSALGSEITPESGILVASHSKGYARTETSARLAAHSALEQARREDAPQIVEDLSLGIDMKIMFSANQLIVWRETELELGEEDNVERFLAFRQNAPDQDTWSPYKIACGLAYSLFRSIQNYRQNDSCGTEIKITHNGYIEALIMFLAEEQINEDPIALDQARFVDRIGGTIKMGDLGAKFIYECKDNQETLTLELRGKQYNIDLAKLEEMAYDYTGGLL